MGQSISQQLATKQREASALSLRQRGSTYEAIARQVGYSSAGGAHKAVHRALRSIGNSEAEEFVVLQTERLNELLTEVWGVATDTQHPGQIKAIDRALRIMHKIDVLYGLDTPSGRPRG